MRAVLRLRVRFRSAAMVAIIRLVVLLLVPMVVYTAVIWHVERRWD